MNVYVNDNVYTRQIEIFIRDAGGREYEFYRVYGDQEIHRVEPGERSEPYLTLEYDVWQAIMREVLGPTPTHDILKDTRQVRDRLLTMVESEWTSRQLEEK